MALFGTLAAIGIPLYANYLEKAKIAKAIADVKAVGVEIRFYELSAGDLPDSLADVGRGSFADPWANPYEYLKIACDESAVFGNAKGGGGKCRAPKGARRDRFLRPLNSDYDLYSKGKNGVSKPQLSGRDSADDILRANNGGYVGLASDF